MSFHRHFEMSISRVEFFRLLPSAVGPFELDGDSDTVRGAVGGGRWTIRLIALPHGRLGRIDVPRHRVEITVEECAEPEGESFVERFRRGFLRGGG
ncbi:MAG: hypothetical protein EHM24_26760 [Acidobacteria bacterium]|nr:MAG: hypothetical protein EHM24_26760 [Acidobacteriota bacterium]